MKFHQSTSAILGESTSEWLWEVISGGGGCVRGSGGCGRSGSATVVVGGD
ncbi:hypothetical protein HanPSC8_Chr15g0655041 [Helianthus annuus]|nr:hypothetical protein HanPSC8_Chr15g0655041 [Helianthus annuus]